jgi:tetratricopeptide (TPR) repeat protein
MLADEPNEPFLLFAIAKEFEGANDLAQARTHYEKLRQTNPNYVGTYYHLGKLYEKLELIEQAIETYATGMNIAKAERDNHALAELAGAKLNLVDDDDDF